MVYIPRLDERLTGLVVEGSARIEVAKNGTILQAGEPADGMIFLESGLAGVYVDSEGCEQLISPVAPGACLGIRLDRDSPNPFTFRALSRCTILHLPEARFRQLVKDAEFRNWCSANQQRNFALLGRIAGAAVQKTTERKIVQFVLVFIESCLGRPAGAEETVPWLITQTHFADMLGVTRTHLNARLTALARKGTLEIRNRKMTLRRPVRMREAQREETCAG